MANSPMTAPIIPSYSTVIPGTGTGMVTCLSCTQIRFGKMVFLSARIKINNTISGTAMHIPLLKLVENVPNYDHSTSTSFKLPSLVVASGTVYADLCYIEFFDNSTWYVTQHITSTLNQNEEVQLFIVYEAV